MVGDSGRRYGVVSPCFMDKEEMPLFSCPEPAGLFFHFIHSSNFCLLRRVRVRVPVSIANEMILLCGDGNFGCSGRFDCFDYIFRLACLNILPHQGFLGGGYSHLISFLALRTAIVCEAIINSSFVGITQTDTLLAEVEICGP
jgi:hypothetical protein